MAVVPLDAARGTSPEREATQPPVPAPGPAARPRGRRLLALGAALAAGPLLLAAHQVRPAPFGDHLTRTARVAAAPDAAGVRLRTSGAAVEAYDTGVRWRYTREGRRPLAVLASSGHAFALWSDGMVTDTDGARGSAVRWHRSVPGVAAWLRTPGARGGAGALQPLDAGARMLAVVTPDRIAAYRTADGDLRWTLPARAGCVFEPAAYVRRGTALLIAQPCADPAVAWSERMVAVDGLGRIVPHREPLGNELPGKGPAGALGNPFGSHR